MHTAHTAQKSATLVAEIKKNTAKRGKLNPGKKKKKLKVGIIEKNKRNTSNAFVKQTEGKEYT